MILQGDARHLPLKDQSVGGIITSPPYNVSKSYPDGVMEHTEYLAFLQDCYAECARVCRGPICWVLPLLCRGHFLYAEVGEWQFATPVIAGSEALLDQFGRGWMREYVGVELLVSTHKPSQRNNNQYGHGRGHAWVIFAPAPFIGPSGRNRPRWHPAPFVREVPSAAMQMFPEVESWLDPFAGTGTTMLAARARGLTTISVDLKWEYCVGQVEEMRQGVLLTC